MPFTHPQGPQRQRRDRRPWVRTEPTTRTVRACGGGAGAPAVGGRGRRTGLGDLTPRLGTASACHPLSRCNRVANVPAVTPCRRENRAGSLADVDGAWC